jgi:hypothetical protein
MTVLGFIACLGVALAVFLLLFAWAACRISRSSSDATVAKFVDRYSTSSDQRKD